ncbi:hypothetical protein Psuf_002420 [Phytohabitans suffuscus]|uniref:Uncharacterized protein n=1 Tax=Phytohabitans suffuscus TaxID=624315 RepID=A0A6F8YA72_9ACTN|nr:hypothetical protein Psuf_002420 [Phytohabitans suffuscus]
MGRDHRQGRTVALGAPAELKRSVGADMVVTVRVDNDPADLAELLRRELDGMTRARPRRPRR